LLAILFKNNQKDKWQSKQYRYLVPPVAKTTKYQPKLLLKVFINLNYTSVSVHKLHVAVFY